MRCQCPLLSLERGQQGRQWALDCSVSRHSGCLLSLRLYLSLVLGNVNVTLLSKQAKYVMLVAEGWLSPRVPRPPLTLLGVVLGFWVNFSRLACDLWAWWRRKPLPPPHAHP